MKKLLHLYNIGHNPFPTFGRGGLGYHPNNSGLGYHLPQYRKRMHGEALHVYKNEDGTNEIIDDMNNDDPNIYDNDERNPVRDAPETREEADVIIEAIDRLSKEKERKEITGKEIEEMNALINELEDYLDEYEENKKVVPEPVKPIKSVPTSAEDKMKIRNYLSSRYTTFKDNKIDKILSDLIKKYPTLTYKLFMSDPDPYLQGTAKMEKEEKKSIAKIKKEVKEEHAKGETETKGHAFENSMINNHQPELKEITGSTTNFKLENVNPIFYNNEDLNDPIMVMFKGELKPLADFSLYDASSNKACIDFKNYTKDEIPIQYSKIIGSPSFTPYFTETSNGLKLFNVLCSNVSAYVNDYDNTDVLIFAKTKQKVGSWSINNFINTYIKESEKIYDIVEGVNCFTPSEAFVNRMIRKGILRESNSHSSGKWFKIHIDDMDIHKMR